MSQGWERLRADLLEQLRTLREGQTVIVREPDEPAPAMAPRPLWTFWQRAPVGDSGRYVQVTRFGDDLGAECVSGAYRQVAGTQHQALLDLGWEDPGSTRGGSDNYQWATKVGDEERLSTLAISSLRALGGSPRAPWSIELVR